MKIVTHHVYPPIPIRRFDWSATTDDYDASFEDGEWRSSSPVGYGATEAEAVADLMQILADTAEEV